MCEFSIVQTEYSVLVILKKKKEYIITAVRVANKPLSVQYIYIYIYKSLGITIYCTSKQVVPG